MANHSERITLSLDSALAYELRKKAGQLEISISALAAAYIENGLFDESAARLNERVKGLLDRAGTLLNRVEEYDHGRHQGARAEAGGVPLSPDEMRAFMLEVLLYFKEIYKEKVGLRGDIAAKVRAQYGDARVKGL